MSLWSKLRGAFGRVAHETSAEPTAPRSAERATGVDAPSDAVARVAKAVALAEGARSEEVRALLERVRGTADEAPVVAALVGVRERLDDEVAVSLARLLSDRGDARAASAVLSAARSSDALVLAADLDADRGEYGAALASIERVLSRRLDAPGARERWRRWSRALGDDGEARGLDDAVTVLAPAPAGVPYRILREVARGGAGTVYEAEEGRLARVVAFKVYHAGRRDRAALEREATLAAALAGPGVVRVFDASPGEGWIALEWAPRGSLRELLRAGAPGDVGRWARDLAGALRRTHGAGWVHGDVKPANVLLSAEGGALLTDFGIARRTGEPTSGGSPGYVSPERLALAAASPADDVYGLGRVVEDLLDAGLAAPPWGLDLVRRCLAAAPARLPDGAAVEAWLEERGA